MTGEFYIYNDQRCAWVDAFTAYGLSLSEGAVAALIAPPPLKEVVTNETRLESGKRYITTPTPHYDERQVTLPCHIRTAGYDDMTAKLAGLTTLLGRGVVRVKTRWQPGVVYRLLYQSCTTFSQGNGRLALFSLKFIEPNPNDRS